MNLNNKIIIVTGGSGLIGKEIIKAIENNNGIAINVDINVTTAIENKTIQCDITNVEAIEKVIQIVIQHFGRIDGLVNNAYPRTKDWGNTFENITVESWKQNVDFQLNTCFVFCQKVLAIMKMQENGSIVNIASQYGIVGPDFTVYDNTELTSPAAYAAIKGAVINFTRYLASYFGKDGIRINTVSPGGVFDNQNKIFVENYNKKVPLKRMGNSYEIGEPVAFLLSDSASYITGHNLVVDGGWTAI